MRLHPVGVIKNAKYQNAERDCFLCSDLLGEKNRAENLKTDEKVKVVWRLVKWESGVDKDSYSVIPTTWIRNFDLFSIADDDEETTRSFRAEWRDTNKPPKGGWPVHEAQIIMTGKEGELRRKLNDLTKMPLLKKEST
ncbi:hypothetical protein HHUSO_G16570 [Huso huso]|uniref:Uncharacterized protein n=1 Tax=Huso huso TaxID=61971 RepID=A0ABR0ZB87_HUSHU